MRKLCSFLIILFSFSVYAKTLPKRVTFSPTKCIISGDDNGKIKSLEGTKTDLLCEVMDNEIKCSQIGGAAEVYDIFINESGLLVIRSKGGNIFFLGDTIKMTYSMASSHLIPTKMALMTKHCVGKIK